MPGTEPYDGAAVPRFARGMKFRHDKVRDAWVVLGPERLFLPDTHAAAVLRLVDGERSVDAIVAALAEEYTAAAAEIGSDVWEMLTDLAGRGVVRLRG